MVLSAGMLPMLTRLVWHRKTAPLQHRARPRRDVRRRAKVARESEGEEELAQFAVLPNANWCARREGASVKLMRMAMASFRNVTSCGMRTRGNCPRHTFVASSKARCVAIIAAMTAKLERRQCWGHGAPRHINRLLLCRRLCGSSLICTVVCVHPLLRAATASCHVWVYWPHRRYPSPAPEEMGARSNLLGLRGMNSAASRCNAMRRSRAHSRASMQTAMG